MEWGDELGFDEFDCNIVDETLQGNLSKYTTGLARVFEEVEAGCNGGN